MWYSEFRSIELNIFVDISLSDFWLYQEAVISYRLFSTEGLILMSERSYSFCSWWLILILLFICFVLRDLLQRALCQRDVASVQRCIINISSTPTVLCKHLLGCTSLLNHIRSTAFMSLLISLYGSRYFCCY